MPAYEILVKPDKDGYIRGNIKNGNPKLSTHFSAAEFQCPCCGEYVVHVQLLEGLEIIRTTINKPMRIVNPKSPGGQGYRCKKYAVALAARNPHAAVNTQHNYGRAADINANFSGVSVNRLNEIALTIPQFKDGGIGLYSWGIHVDTRGKKARWDYRK